MIVLWTMRKYADPVDDRSLPRTFGVFTATYAAASKGMRIVHVVKPVHHMTYVSSGSMVKVLIDPTAVTITSCYQWGIAPYFVTGKPSVFGRFCTSCGSAIATIRKPFMSDSFSATISRNGFASFPSARHVFSSLMLVSRNGDHSDVQAPVPFLILLYTGIGNSTSWLADGLSCAPTVMSVLSSMMRVEIELALSVFRIRRLKKASDLGRFLTSSLEVPPWVDARRRMGGCISV